MLGKRASSKHLSYGHLSGPARSLVAWRRTDDCSRLSCTVGRPQSVFIVKSRAHKSIYQGSNRQLIKSALDNSEQAEMVKTHVSQGVNVFGKSQLSAKYRIKIANIDWIFMTQIA